MKIIIGSLFLCVLLLQNTGAFAKKSEVFELEAVDSITGYASFDKVKVVDIRKHTDSIGQGSYNRPIVFSEGVTNALKKISLQIAHSSMTQAHNELLIVVRNIDIRGLGYISTIQLRLGFYLGNDDHYALAKNVDTLIEFPINQMKPMKTMQEATNYVFTAFIKDVGSMEMPETSNVREGLAQIVEKDKEVKARYEIYNAEPKPGIYYTMEAFLQNKPDEVVFDHDHYADYAEDRDRFYLLNEKGKHRINLADTVCFAAVYNGKYYKMAGNHIFYEMKMVDGDWIYKAVLKGINFEAGRNFVATQFGLVGALMYAGLSTAEDVKLSDAESAKRKLVLGLYNVRLDAEEKKPYKLKRIR